MEQQSFRGHGGGPLRRLIHRLFPERQLHFRTEGRVSFIRLSHRGQIALVVLLALAGSWMAVASVSYVLQDQLLATKDNQIANARLAYRSLLDEVAEYQREFAGLTRDLEENHVMMLNLVEQNTSLQQSLKTVEVQLEDTEEERGMVAAAREKLKADLRDIEAKMGSLSGRNFVLRDNLDSVEGDLQTALAERNQALFDGSRMRRQIKEIEARMRRQSKELEVRLTRLQDSEQEAILRLSERTVANISRIERVIGLAGLKVSRLLGTTGSGSLGQGGPFVAVKPDGLPGDRMKAELTNLGMRLDRWQALQRVMRILPLTAPLNSYSVSSSFGKRRDPINRRWAAHYGIDLIGVFRSSVYATASGLVTHAGWKGRYGKLVEVTHGAGIKTRYGHLSKILVKKGQTIKFRKKIGLLGNTGRSTGAHIHYEIIVNDKPRNPAKFIKAGRYVLQD